MRLAQVVVAAELVVKGKKTAVCQCGIWHGGGKSAIQRPNLAQ